MPWYLPVGSGVVQFVFIYRFCTALITVADAESFRVFTRLSLFDRGSFGEGAEVVSFLGHDLL